jgi:hypothetical protein
MGEACSTYGKEVHTWFWVGGPDGNYNLGNLGVDGRITGKW